MRPESYKHEFPKECQYCKFSSLIRTSFDYVQLACNYGGGGLESDYNTTAWDKKTELEALEPKLEFYEIDREVAIASQKWLDSRGVQAIGCCNEFTPKGR